MSEYNKDNGFIAYEGPSRLDGKPIVVIVTGVGCPSKRSKNTKTGPMAQVFIIRSHIDPINAISSGGDESICGKCPMRGVLEKKADGTTTNRMRSCYVEVDKSVLSIYGAYKRGAYPKLTPDVRWETQETRLGAYGDPSAAPFAVMKDLVSRGHKKNTGYTHQHADRKFHPMRKLVMASVHSKEEAVKLHEKGWRTFRTMSPGDTLLPNERACPASEEGGKRMTCDRCLGCSGTGIKDTRGKAISFAIVAHGSPSKLSSYNKTFSELPVIS